MTDQAVFLLEFVRDRMRAGVFSGCGPGKDGVIAKGVYVRWSRQPSKELEHSIRMHRIELIALLESQSDQRGS